MNVPTSRFARFAFIARIAFFAFITRISRFGISTGFILG